AEAFRALVPGISQWGCPSDLRHIDLLGFPKAFVDMGARTRAAQFRVYHLEAASTGGLRVRQRAAGLRRAHLAADDVVMKATWADWFAHSFLLQLDASAGHFELRGAQLVKATFQRTAAASLPQVTTLELEVRIRHKLSRWRVPELPRIRVSRCIEFLQALRGRAPPRVWAATWRTLWNGWATSRRTQGARGLAGCMFRCSDEAPDSIEHYATCPRLHEVTGRRLGLPRVALPGARLSSFLGLDFRANSDPARAVCVAVRATAAYRTHCQCRHGQVSRGPAAMEALDQSCRE
ncbi:unnamed protein product, partial [Prorocentrum cordatum]